jgi:hypothetical protein
VADPRLLEYRCESHKVKFGTCRPQWQVEFGRYGALCSFASFSASSDSSVSCLTLTTQMVLSRNNANTDVSRLVSECRAKSPCDEATLRSFSLIHGLRLRVCTSSSSRHWDA